jgi:Cu+-exporting ATPase
MNPSAALVHDLIDLTFSVHGMTCASCVGRVEKAIKSVQGVASAPINLATEKASVHLLKGTAIETVAAAVATAGYEVPTETISLAISGMTCASCVGRVEAGIPQSRHRGRRNGFFKRKCGVQFVAATPVEARNFNRR